MLCSRLEREKSVRKCSRFDYKVYIIIYYDKRIIVYDINSYLTTICVIFLFSFRRFLPSILRHIFFVRFSLYLVCIISVCHRFIVIAVVFYLRWFVKIFGFVLSFRRCSACVVRSKRLNNVVWSYAIRLIRILSVLHGEWWRWYVEKQKHT